MSYIVTFLIGILCIVLGISNRKGNISSLHSYHRKRVRDEDKIPYGKKVGLGTIICGGSLIVFSILSAIAFYTGNSIFISIGDVLFIIGLTIGLGLSFYAMIKYNKGIF